MGCKLLCSNRTIVVNCNWYRLYALFGADGVDGKFKLEALEVHSADNNTYSMSTILPCIAKALKSYKNVLFAI